MGNKEITLKIREALELKYPFPEWVFLHEVPNNTGCLANRAIDCLAMNMYPSKNHEKIGFEIKTLKSDLLKELKDGSKSDAIAKYCDIFYLVTPKGLITNDIEIPTSWGIMEYHNNKIRQIKQANKIESEPITNGFVAGILQSLMRKFKKTYEKEIDERLKIEKENLEFKIKNEVEEKVLDFKYNKEYEEKVSKNMIEALNMLKKSNKGFYANSPEKMVKYALIGINCENANKDLEYIIKSLVEKKEKIDSLIKKNTD